MTSAVSEWRHTEPAPSDGDIELLIPDRLAERLDARGIYQRPGVWWRWVQWAWWQHSDAGKGAAVLLPSMMAAIVTDKRGGWRPVAVYP